MTGFAGRANLPVKELEILAEFTPKMKRVLLLFEADDPSSLGWRDDARVVAKKLGLNLIERDVSDPAGIKPMFDRMKRGQAQAVVFASNTIRHRFQMDVLTLATSYGMPMVGSRKDAVEQGALFSYSYDFAKVGRAAAGRYLDRVLKGTKPGDLPIEEVTEYELTVNRSVARRYGLNTPDAVLLRAERVID